MPSTSSRTRNTFSPIYLVSANTSRGPQVWPGGEGLFCASMTGAGTIRLEYALPDENTADSPPEESALWVAAGEDTTLAASGGGIFSLPSNTRIRAVVTGVTNGYAVAKQID